MTRNLAAYTDSFDETKAAFDPSTEEEIIVLAADGKGVPMRRPLEQRLQEQWAATAAMLRQSRLKGSRAKTVRDTTTYFENNKQYMNYDEYLAAGYSIGTGVAEGACRHFVKDRMELSVMRWEIEGAQAMLTLRAFYLND